MSQFTYKEILQRAYDCRNSVTKEYKLGIPVAWSYYFAKSILNPKKPIKKLNYRKATSPAKGDAISRQIPKESYLKLCQNHIAFIEEKKRMPSYNRYGSFKLNQDLICYALARIVIYQYKNNKLPGYVNVNSKCFTKPTETGNAVYDYACKKYGRTFKTLDDILEYVANHFNYEFYFDDSKSNKQVTDSKAGNCTDLLQWLINMVEPLGYEWKCLHVQCRQSGTGHVRGQFRHKKYTENTWVNRDIAAVADNGSIHSIWCSDGYLLATNPSWFVENLRR